MEKELESEELMENPVLEVQGCSLTDEELKEFKDGYGDTTPCLEYGCCELCPYSSDEE